MKYFPQSILIDTTTYNKHSQGNTQVSQLLNESSHVYIDQMTVGTLITQFTQEADQNESGAFQKYLNLNIFLDSDQIKILDVDLNTAKIYGRISVDLYEQTRPLSTEYIWKAALAMQHNLTLITQHKDVQAITGLQHIIV